MSILVCITAFVCGHTNQYWHLGELSPKNPLAFCPPLTIYGLSIVSGTKTVHAFMECLCLALIAECYYLNITLSVIKEAAFISARILSGAYSLFFLSFLIFYFSDVTNRCTNRSHKNSQTHIKSEYQVGSLFVAGNLISVFNYSICNSHMGSKPMSFCPVCLIPINA